MSELLSCPVGARKTNRAGEAAAPAVEQRGNTWSIRSYELSRQLLRNYPDDLVQAGFSAEVVKGRLAMIELPVLYKDGPEHRQNRTEISRFFAPTTVDRNYRELMEARADELVAQARQTREFSLDQMSMRMAVHVAAQVVGLTASPVDDMARRLETFLTLPVPDRQATPTRWGRFTNQLTSLRAAGPLLSFYLRDLLPAIKARRAQPRDDVISHLLSKGAKNGDILAECITYGAAGMVTTREYIVVAALHFLDQPELIAEYLAAEQPRRYQILWEMLRLEPVVGHIYRRALNPISITDGDQQRTIPPGASIDLYVRPANADPAAVGDGGDELYPDRTRARGVRPEVLSFGDGAHKCPGAHLAIQESDILLTRLLARPLELISAPRLTWVDTVAGYELRGVNLRIVNSRR